VSDSEIAAKVVEVVARQLEVDPDQVTPETSFINDLGADSLDTVELIMEFENEFGVNIPDEEAENIQTVGEAIKYVKEHLKADSSS
jgi:acyl carrier protein